MQKPLSKKHNPLAKWPFIFLAPFLLSYLCFTLYPTLYSFYISLTDWSAVDMANRTYIGFRNYARVFTQDKLFWKSIYNTFRLLLLSMPVTIIAGLLMSVLMYSLKRCRQFFQTVNFLPYIITPVAIGLLFAFLFDWNIGLVNQALLSLGLIRENLNWLGNAAYAPYVVSLMVIWKNFGYFMVLYMAGLSTIPEELYEAATVDGSNAVHTFFHITFPMLRPIHVFVVINGIIGGLQLFDEPIQAFIGNGMNVVGGPRRSVLTAVWYFYDTSFRNNSRYGYGAAVAFALFLIIACVSLINVKLFNRKEA